MKEQILNSIDSTLLQGQLMCERTGHSPATLRTLIALHRGGALRVSDIADRVRITQQAVGKTLRMLQHDNMLVINTDESDRRAKLVELTTTGKTELRTIIGAWR